MYEPLDAVPEPNRQDKKQIRVESCAILNPLDISGYV